MYKYILLSIFLGFSYSQTYCAGDQVSITHQNSVHTVGAGIEGYEVGDEFRLADWNGDLNGGDYKVILFRLTATW